MIPDFQSMMRPLLNALSDGGERDTVWLRDQLADVFGVTESERVELLPSGRAKLFDNRMGWAYTYLYKVGAIDRVRRGAYRITSRGQALLAENPERIDIRVLDQFPELAEFRKGHKGDPTTPTPPPLTGPIDPPLERIASAHHELRTALRDQLLDRVKRCDPTFFEQLVIRLLVKMGYGGSEAEAGEHIGRSGDGGVDGVINEDRLGLDRIYVQAKRWADTPVGRPEIQAFVGALEGRAATKGVFITASSFTKGAREYSEQISRRVILIDGSRLTELMVDYAVGVANRETFAIQEVDEDFFVEELG